MAILTLPTISDLATFSGRPEESYTAYANQAILLATIQFQTVTELQPSDMVSMSASSPEDYQLAWNGILSLADYYYLRQPYQAAIAGPFVTEQIGSYSYAKAQNEVARNAAALEVQGEAIGVPFYDLAVRMLAKRTRAGGVFFGEVWGMEHTTDDDPARIVWVCNPETGQQQLAIVGPEDTDKGIFPFDINAPTFPQDPGI